MRWKVATILLGLALLGVMVWLVLPSLLNRPPFGYQLWRDLPIPEYVVLTDVRATRHPLSTDTAQPCTQARFKHDLPDMSVPAREMRYQWERQGLRYVRRTLAFDAFQFANGRTVFTAWQGAEGPIISRRTMTIIDCPSGSGPAV